MNRRTFIKSATVSGVTLSLLPTLAFQSAEKIIPFNELIGKGNPSLFGSNFKLKKEAHNAFIKMKTDALKSNLNIKIVSSYRSFDDQKRIWERKYKKNLNQGMSPTQSIQNIIQYSTIPGTSRHH